MTAEGHKAIIDIDWLRFVETIVQCSLLVSPRSRLLFVMSIFGGDDVIVFANGHMSKDVIVMWKRR